MRRVKEKGQCDSLSALALVRGITKTIDRDIITCLEGGGKMIKIETNDHIKCEMEGEYRDLLIESLVIVRTFYETFANASNPIHKEAFLRALHNDLFLDALDPFYDAKIKFKEEKSRSISEEVYRRT